MKKDRRSQHIFCKVNEIVRAVAVAGKKVGARASTD